MTGNELTLPGTRSAAPAQPPLSTRIGARNYLRQGKLSDRWSLPLPGSGVWQKRVLRPRGRSKL